jgi:hypothetical protein
MEWALFDGLAPESADRILAAARRVRLSRGEVMFHEGDHGESVFLVEAGKVAVRISTPEGALVTVALLGPGSAIDRRYCRTDRFFWAPIRRSVWPIDRHLSWLGTGPC